MRNENVNEPQNQQSCQNAVSKSVLKFEYGFNSANGLVKKKYYLHEIPFMHDKCDVWQMLPLIYVRQFTGVEDKNGIEVYVGDIDKKGRVCEYFQKLGSFGFKNPNYAPVTFLGQWIDNDGLVVGSIYDSV